MYQVIKESKFSIYLYLILSSTWFRTNI